MKIPCDTIARLSNLLPEKSVEIDDIFRTIRLDNGKVIVSDRRFMAIETVENFEGVFHIAVSDALIEQCRVESQFSSFIDIVPNPILQFTTAVTTMGYAPEGNIGVWPNGVTDFDDWHSRVVKPCLEPDGQNRGVLAFDAVGLQRLVSASPSGFLVFEETIDTTRPMVVRDATSPDWCGFFMPRLNDGLHHTGATVPRWLV